MGKVVAAVTDGCTAQISSSGDTTTLRFIGDLCADTADWAGSWADVAQAMAERRLVIDLTDVGLLGAAGVTVLVRARRSAAAAGTDVELRPPRSRQVRWVLEACGLTGPLAGDLGTCRSGGATEASTGFRPSRRWSS